MLERREHVPPIGAQRLEIAIVEQDDVSAAVHAFICRFTARP